MNKGYIKITLALLSIVGCMQNIAFASETAATTNSSNDDDKYQAYFDPVAAKKHLEAKHAKEAKQGADIMTEALSLYADVVNLLWNPNGAKDFDDTFIEGYFPKVYNENLAVVQHRYASSVKSWPLFYHALANKVELSEKKTVILLVSSNIEDSYYHFNKEYINPIVKSANSFRPYIDSEDDIRGGKLIKIYANLVGFIIEKEEDCVKITYVSSFNLDFSPGFPDHIARKVLADRILKVINLKNIFKSDKPLSMWNFQKK
ncbi:fam-a protein [Plasmodium vinckei vinckei]|uniref:Fam-a protein n=1 Tax=Plasmodium vinckei vinckei TaxID=54757 RepID=A0A449BYG9_PLAVN|nr:fam-a protein [Plasmodium vinckei vinckei]VEV58359.1 fam-a protein [Plasmodium vinckei vinckei]